MAQLQKKDLAKEFSQVVQQEIKNHNDLLLSSNMALEELKRNLYEFKTQSGHRFGTMIAEIESQSIDIDSFKKSIEETLGKFKSQINDASDLNKSQLFALRKAMEERESYFFTISGFQEFKSKVDEWIAQIQRAFSQQRDAVTNEISKAIEANKASVEETRKTLQDSIKKQSAIIDEQDKQFDLLAINFNGIKQEIEVLKKRCFIIDKNIENIYTQIERLKVIK